MTASLRMFITRKWRLFPLVARKTVVICGILSVSILFLQTFYFQSAKRSSTSSRIERSKSFDLFYGENENQQLIHQSWHHKNEPYKKILFWTRDNDNGRLYLVGLGPDAFRSAGCPVWQCETHDTLMNLTIPVEDYDAVVFFEPAWGKRDRPSKRSTHQRYVYWNLESPGWFRHYQEWEKLAGFFNWTMTYRWDSDIVNAYGWITPYPPQSPPLLISSNIDKNYAKGKTKLAAWLVSNCVARSGRMEYIQRLAKFVQVDVYGHCGTLRCPRSDDESCRQMIERTYKFYISFENSLCIDYVTEKFFRTIQYNIIPIVFDVHGNYEQLAPSHSYINALDFPSVRHLADYLLELDQNDELYNQYFWWKDKYVVHESPKDFKRGFCGLCSLLHDPSNGQKIYHNLTDWWGSQAQCKSVTFNDSFTNQLSLISTKSFLLPNDHNKTLLDDYHWTLEPFSML